MDDFTKAYLTTLFWSTSDGERESLEDFGVDDISPETRAAIEADCARFQAEYRDVWKGQCLRGGYPEDEMAAHDFALTRNHHGAGFWDGDWQEPAATKLTEAAHRFGEFNCYVGDDGLIYHE